MRKLILLLTTLILSLTMMFASPSYAEWVKVDENVKGTNYVDFERIRKVDGYVYYWELTNFSKPTNSGDLSVKVYLQGECKLFRYKILSFSIYSEPMGGGTGETANLSKKWKYPHPKSLGETVLKTVCVFAN